MIDAAVHAIDSSGTNGSSWKVALDQGKAFGIIKPHDRVVICQRDAEDYLTVQQGLSILKERVCSLSIGTPVDVTMLKAYFYPFSTFGTQEEAYVFQSIITLRTR